MTDREEIRQRMKDDGVRFLLAQFVDLNGSPKVKMVPVEHFEDILDDGAGFAGASLPGMGQGPHAHDMMARIDLDSYTCIPGTTVWPASPATCSLTANRTCSAPGNT